MKYLLIFLFTITAQAEVCNLTTEKTQAGNYYVECGRVGPGPYTKICTGFVGETKGEDYKIEIKTPSDSILNVGGVLDSYRDWSQGDTLAPGESIVCSIDSDKKQTRLDAEQAKVDAEKVIKDKKKSDWEAVCASAKAGFETLICQERGL